MTDQPQLNPPSISVESLAVNSIPVNSIHVKTPCPKTWEQLAGDDAKRYCSACSLHVLNSARLTRAHAHELVANARERVCMRVELDACGAPVFLDSPRRASSAGPTPSSMLDSEPGTTQSSAPLSIARPIAVPAANPAHLAVAARAARWALGAAAGLLAACQRTETLGRVAATTPPPPDANQSAALLGEVAGQPPIDARACAPVEGWVALGAVAVAPPVKPAPTPLGQQHEPAQPSTPNGDARPRR